MAFTVSLPSAVFFLFRHYFPSTIFQWPLREGQWTEQRLKYRRQFAATLLAKRLTSLWMAKLHLTNTVRDSRRSSPRADSTYGLCRRFLGNPSAFRGNGDFTILCKFIHLVCQISMKFFCHAISDFESVFRTQLESTSWIFPLVRCLLSSN